MVPAIGDAGDIVRLCWHDWRGTGTAHFDGVMVRLRQCPRVAGLPVGLIEVDFFDRQGELRIGSDARREMTAAECISVIGYLEGIATAARRRA